VSQLAHRLFGPLQPARIRVVLDYHGLLVNRAGALADIAARHHVTASTVSYNTAAVRAAGIKQPLSPSVVIDAERDSTPDDDHLGRVRIATTLGLTRPELASVGHPLDDGGSLSSAQLAVARTALRLLTAVGPLTLPTIWPRLRGPAASETGTRYLTPTWPPRCSRPAAPPMTSTVGTRQPVPYRPSGTT
jgi:hypothetical protein